jgi:ADP-heptose:LPS heptosyltransferase
LINVFLPFRGEFGHLLMWHAPIINAFEGKKAVCCEKGQEALFSGVLEYIYVDPRPEDICKTASVYRDDKDLFKELKKKISKKYPNANFLEPAGEFDKKYPRKYISYQPYVKQNIKCDIVVCPRKRVLASGRNWELWPKLVDKLKTNYSVFAVGSPTASFDVDCSKAWSYERFLDATLEAIQNSKIVVCTDSGLAHLAVQCSKPIIMITYKGQPGPDTKWKVKWNRYKEENHMNSVIKEIDAWEDLGLVLETIKKEIEQC